MNLDYLGHYSPKLISDLYESCKLVVSFYLEPEEKKLKEIYKGQYVERRTDLITTEYYAYFIERLTDEIIIQYLFFYSLNDDIFRGKLPKHPGRHEGDWEHCNVHLIYDPVKNDYVIDRIYYAAHQNCKTGSIHYPKSIQFDDNHPVVYSALPGHASYANVFKINDKLDSTDHGYSWKPYIKNNIVDVTDLNGWTNYRGPWGSRAYKCSPASTPFEGCWMINPNTQFYRALHDNNNRQIEYILCNSIDKNYSFTFRLGFPSRIKNIIVFGVCSSEFFSDGIPKISFDIMKPKNKKLIHINNLQLNADCVYYSMKEGNLSFVNTQNFEYDKFLCDTRLTINNMNVDKSSRFDIELHFIGE